MRTNAFTNIFSISLLSALAMGLMACTPTNFKPSHHTAAYECKGLQHRGLISLEQERACRMGQPYEHETVTEKAHTHTSDCPCPKEKK